MTYVTKMIKFVCTRLVDVQLLMLKNERETDDCLFSSLISLLRLIIAFFFYQLTKMLMRKAVEYFIEGRLN
jgi:hypothetical protein